MCIRDREKCDPIIYFYRSAFDRVMDGIKNSKVENGTAAIWLLYNMGYVVKTPSGCFAIDISHRWAKELAPYIDFLCVTHKHSDHYNNDLIQAMFDLGKPVLSNYLKDTTYPYTAKGDKMCIRDSRWKSPEDPGNGQVNRANRKSKGYNGRTSTWHLEDGSYLRLQNVTLGYTLPKNLTQRFFVEKLRVYVSGQNLWTSTGYSGYNPEVNARPSNSLSPGEDYGTYPLAKTFLFGLNITLEASFKIHVI